MEEQPPSKLARVADSVLLEDVYYDDEHSDADDEKLPSKTLVFSDPTETPYQLEQIVEKNVPVYGRFFKTREDLTEFMMLPLNDKQRQELLVVMSQDIRAKRDAVSSAGSSQSRKRDLPRDRFTVAPDGC